MPEIWGIPKGGRVFVDTNIFFYHFGEVSLQCSEFLQRVVDRELFAFTSTAVLGELLHQRMRAEAKAKGLLPYGVRPPEYLKAHPEVVQGLTQYHKDLRNVLRIGVELIRITQTLLVRSQSIRRSHGVMTNDSLNLTCMKSRELDYLVTTDGDFERIPEITVWKPMDLI